MEKERLTGQKTEVTEYRYLTDREPRRGYYALDLRKMAHALGKRLELKIA